MYGDSGYGNKKETSPINVWKIVRRTIGVIVVIVGIFVLFGSYKIVEPGTRGVRVTLGYVSPNPLDEGIHLKWPFISKIVPMTIKVQNGSFKTPCYSSDMQQIEASVAVIYSIPSNSVVSLYREYDGDPFKNFVMPRVQEALKESTVTRTAEDSVKEREKVKLETLEGIQRKVNGLVYINDFAIINFDLSDILERAIEDKMVQQQLAAKATFTKQQATTDAETAKIRARGEADAIQIRGDALKNNSGIVALQIVEKWDGHCPSTVVVGDANANVLLPAVSAVSK